MKLPRRAHISKMQRRLRSRTFIHKCDFLRIAQAHGAPYVLITEHLLLLVCAHVESNVTLGARDWSLLYQTQENVQQT